MGHAEEFEMVCGLDEDGLEGTDRKSPAVTLDDKRFIKENAKLECPPTEVDEYLKIFEKYHGIFSRHKMI